MLDSRLTIKHLKMIHAIDAAETLTHAAELLHISQPALSSRLQDAEEILNTRLFHRQGRKLRILPAGQLLLRSARKILKALSDVENELAHLPGHAVEAFRIGMPQYASYAWLPQAIRAFEHTFPSSSIEIVSEAAVHPRQALQRREVDIALVSSPAPSFQIDRSRYRSRRLFRDEFVALLPADHRKIDRKFLLPEDFIDETYITNNAVPERNREYELFFQPNGVFPERVVHVGFTGAIFELVAAGVGTTIFTRWILQSSEHDSRVVSRPLTRSGLFAYWFAIFPREGETRAKALALCEAIAQSGAFLD